jgi:carboxypeptidase C (cathepsin A)
MVTASLEGQKAGETTPNNSSADKSKKEEYQAPKGATKSAVWRTAAGREVSYKATSEWIVLRKKEIPSAEIFHTHYHATEGADRTERADRKENRPITFIFNGGPGASSAYLHIGGLGPQRVEFSPDGEVLPPPARLTNNTESWLEFTDLVFVDPVGTGFSRVLETEEPADGKAKKDPKKTVEEKEFYKLNRDLEALGEFIERFLSKHKLWGAPIYIAGESYGGFRTAKLARRLQEAHGVGLSAVIAISPALEWSLLNPNDYDVLHFIDTFATLALTAVFHGRSRKFKKGQPVEEIRAQIESFAARDLTQALILGASHPEAELTKVLNEAADYLGLDPAFVRRAHGRIPFWRFARELLKDKRQVLGFYDGTLTAIDPFPDRDMLEAPDPTLVGVERVFAGGINQVFRTQIGLETERLYALLSMEVNTAWQRDEQKHAFDLIVGATDDLRFAMCMNPHMKVLITHGYYDMVTPYFSSQRLIEQMKLLPEQRRNLLFRNFGGGHMFYTWEDSRRAFRDWVRGVYETAGPVSN